MSKKILFINQEISPYVPESAMAIMGNKLPQMMQEQGNEIRTFMPKWGCINERRGQLHEVQRLTGMNLIIDDTDHPLVIKVASIPVSRLSVYFIDNDDYFFSMEADKRGDEDSENGERAIFFARAVLQTVMKMRWVPDVIHCQGWMSAFVPMYIKTAYHDEPSFTNTKVITSLFEKDLSYHLGSNFKRCMEFREVSADLLKDYREDFDFLELGKLAIDYSDGIIEASPEVNSDLLSYAKSRDIPMMDYPGSEDYQDAYLKFYQKYLGQE